MYIQKYENYPLELKEINYEAFYNRLGVMQNVFEDCKFTGIYVKEEPKQYIVWSKGIFYKIPMTEREFKSLEEKYQKREHQQNPNNNNINGFSKLNAVNKKLLTIREIIFLYEKLGESIEVAQKIRVNHNDKFITKKDILELVKNVTILEREINNRNLRNNPFELIKYIYNYYKMNTYYWISDGYGYGTRNLDLTRVESTANHPYSYLGLINERYVTCQGMSQGLAQLYNYFGIKADTASNGLHSVTRLHLSDNCVTYIDLAKEISPQWKDSLYEGWNKRSNPIKCTNPNAYNWFCKNIIGLGQINEETNVPITLCDNFGRLQVPLIDKEKMTRPGFEVKAVHQPPIIPGFKVKR